MDLVVRRAETASPGALDVEVVERKGLGHPDTICDAVGEHICVRLCRYYLERFGEVLHHNVDKVLLVGGSAKPTFGGGEVTAPMEVYLAGRATDMYRGERIPIHDIAVEACREWLQAHLRGVDVDRHVRIIPRLRPGSADLVRLFARHSGIPLANDTSCGTGFARLTDLEAAVLEVERHLNHPDTKRNNPEIGEDIKVMGIRKGTRIDLTIACAFVARCVRDTDDYKQKKNTVRELALAAARRVGSADVSAVINAADDLATGDVFLTVTGTSAEAGDDGEVGRGNRASGLITPYRPMTMEAAAGKNPVTHVGKLYNILANRIAAALVNELRGVTGAECVLVSRIGQPVSDPDIVDVQLACEDGATALASRQQVHDIVRSSLERVTDLRDALLQETVSVF